MEYGKALPIWERPSCSFKWCVSKQVQAPCPEDGGVVSILLVLPLSFPGCLKYTRKEDKTLVQHLVAPQATVDLTASIYLFSIFIFCLSSTMELKVAYSEFPRCLPFRHSPAPDLFPKIRIQVFLFLIQCILIIRPESLSFICHVSEQISPGTGWIFFSLSFIILVTFKKFGIYMLHLFESALFKCFLCRQRNYLLMAYEDHLPLALQ